MSQLPAVLASFKEQIENKTAIFLQEKVVKDWMKGKKRTEEEKAMATELLEAYAAMAAERLKPSAPPPPPPKPRQERSAAASRPAHGPVAYGNPAGGGPNKVYAINCHPAEVLGAPFHNPYTFVPFPDQPLGKRTQPTPLSIDEVEKDRFTGVLDLEIELLSPLLSSQAIPYHGKKGQHQKYHALCIGDDVILPATGVRGSLRTLMTVLTGGTLGYVDEEAWLCQGRDARLGPRNPKNHNSNIPRNPILAEIIHPGGVNKGGTIRLGETRLVKLRDLEHLCGAEQVSRMRPKPGFKPGGIYVDEALAKCGMAWTEDTPWRVKLSGRPINLKGKREGIFLSCGIEVHLPAPYWAAYAGRNRHGDFPELRPGDLVWIEPKNPDICEEDIRVFTDIASIQWARWGRTGQRLLDAVSQHHSGQIPDCFNPDGKVDEVTNLFGQVSREDHISEIEAFQGKDGSPAAAFAARIRTGNLIFRGGKAQLETAVTLAPLAPPHPGCSAFYRQPKPGAEDHFADKVWNGGHSLRGFKVYRTQKGESRPWEFKEQGICGDSGQIDRDPYKKVNKTVDLLKSGTGRIRLSLRGLNDRELALLLAACAVDWRLGGGKPFGLGHARVKTARLMRLDREGNLFDEPDGTLQRTNEAVPALPPRFQEELAKTPGILERMSLYQTSQIPVERVRYPRAAVCNRNKVNRGGHVWFNRHASLHKSASGDDTPEGLEILHVSRSASGTLQGKIPGVQPQPLPLLKDGAPGADRLYGYDLYSDDNRDSGYREESRGTTKPQIKLEPFDPNQHPGHQVRSGGNHSNNQRNRQNWRDQRRR